MITKVTSTTFKSRDEKVLKLLDLLFFQCGICFSTSETDLCANLGGKVVKPGYNRRVLILERAWNVKELGYQLCDCRL
jgi:hypothetical protein